MIIQKKLFFIGILFLSIFTLFSWSVKRGAFKSADFVFTVKVQETIDTSTRLRAKAFIKDVMEGATFFASPETSIVAVLILTGFFGYDRKKRKIRWSALFIPFLFGLLALAEGYGKTVVHHPAPPFFMIKNPTTLFPKYYINEQFSYPSGHAARAVFLAISSYVYFIFHTSYFKRKSKKILLGLGLLCYVGVVALSRVYLGHHWLSDVVGGLFLGISSALVSFFLKDGSHS